MSNQVTTAFVRQYNSVVTFLYQQKGSKLRGRLREKATSAEYDHFDRIGATAAVKKTTRHGATPLVNTLHTRRRGALVDYEWADLVDKADEVRLMIQPTSSYAVNAAMAMGRAYDDEAILGFEQDALEGVDGGTTTTWATYVATATDHNIAAGSAGLTVAKLQNAKLALDVGDVPEEGRHIVVSPEGMIDLLSDPQVTSTDFNTIKALVNGTLGEATYMGFSFVSSTRLPLSSNTRTCYAWHNDAMGMLTGMDFTTRITERDDLSYSTQIFMAGSFKAIRVQDEGVVEINIDESV